MTETGVVVPAFDDHNPPSRELVDDCVHCGFCLPACPTYQLWGNEADSPRGRILLMDVALRGEVPMSPGLARHWDQCLGCMACVTACPSGVRYDRLIEQTRQQVERGVRRGRIDRMRRRAVFALFPHPRRMRALALLLLVFRASGLRRLLRRPGGGGLIALSPAVSGVAVMTRIPELVPARGPEARRRAVLLTGCVQQGLFADVNAATARVLAAFGCEVSVPRGQGCCGALDLHCGREPQALSRARALRAVLDTADGAPPERPLIAVNSAGCGSAMKEYGVLFDGDGDAADFASRVRDVSELLAELQPAPGTRLHELPLRVAYHDACHLAHAQGIRVQPREMLRRIPGVELVPLAEADMCCGSAGVYNLLEPKPAAELGRRKAAHVAAAAPDVLVASNPGCLVQIGAHLGGGSGVPAFHPVELLDASIRGEDAAELVRRRRRLQGLPAAASAPAPPAPPTPPGVRPS
ncbi:MAG TPA: heterodisulfide reductase-related iron-sulfur binding cluster [Candidatus Angelobacter sp.]|jgi:glycolate oxidase iron-sulfur subunit|nr:heterodisulfide reductase-related iron-sulfur binding cluster [Candidatus Angelobacter sp.]